MPVGLLFPGIVPVDVTVGGIRSPAYVVAIKKDAVKRPKPYLLPGTWGI